MTARKQYRWVRVGRRGVSWHLVPVEDAAYWDLFNVSNRAALVTHEAGRQWRVTVDFHGHMTWALLGSTDAARRWAEDYLARKSWHWDDCEIARPGANVSG